MTLPGPGFDFWAKHADQHNVVRATVGAPDNGYCNVTFESPNGERIAVMPMPPETLDELVRRAVLVGYVVRLRGWERFSRRG